MRPKKLTLCAWGPYRNKEEVDFDAFEERGIFLITGATGAGKTTVFDAITYALYGALSGEERNREKNSVRSDFADPSTPTFVELFMEHGGKEYHIRRNPEYFRPSKKKKSNEGSEPSDNFTKEKENAILYLPDGRVMEGVREVNGALLDILGLDYAQFKKISMIAQGEFARLLVASPGEKTKIFRELFGTGIYEKFTQNLKSKAAKLYGKVMEQKSKLEEDIRVLVGDMEKSGWNEERGWSQESGERLFQLTDADNWNYEDLLECIAGMECEAQEKAKIHKKAYEEADKKVEKQTKELVRLKQINQNLDRLKQAISEKEHLESLAEEYQSKEKQLKHAQNAGFVESAEERLVQVRRQIQLNLEEQEASVKEQEKLLEEESELKTVMEQADKIRELVNQKKSLEELKKEKQALQEEHSEKSEQLKNGQNQYLEEEENYRREKAVYEDADHRRKLSAIGLVAAMLEEGKPCPVCGATSHPMPAQAAEDVVSEEELERLKARADKKEEKIRDLHEKMITLKTQVEGLTIQIERAEDRIVRMEESLLKEQDFLCRKYLEMPVGEALSTLQKKCERGGRIGGLLQEKEEQEKRLQEKASDLSMEAETAEDSFAEMLRQYAFADAEVYRQAKLSLEERETLQKNIADYRNKVAANVELCQHLKETVGDKNPVDSKQAEQIFQECKNDRDKALKEQKTWDNNLAEVKKIHRLMKEKLARIQEDNKEYGFVKDLENMATGNNPKRLVFEQYVLAGYFEEILRAANLRFVKMTAGRYEMRRVNEVGDGRVKDNLEIQVLDYYTGKYRSVRTLSGGESFKASLALALGLSDVIQSMNGGIRVDTLFVDEGFGALDEESLNQACDALMSLVEKNRLIGIISHVRELRERIENQLIIDKTNSGSTIRNSV